VAFREPIVNQTVSNDLQTGQKTINSLDKRSSSAMIVFGNGEFFIKVVDIHTPLKYIYKNILEE
jgi:hypothetical protein